MDGAALARRMKREGYLFIKGLVPRQPILELRRQFLGIAAEAGWLRRGRPADEAIAEPNAACSDPEPEHLEVLRRQYALEALHALPHHPAVVGLFERMLGGPVLVHPVIIARNVFPHSAEFDNTTVAHQDYPHVQGTTECFTAWMPLGACPKEMGGLAVALGSHRDGVRDFGIATDSGGMRVLDPLTGRWAASDLEAGDVVIFHSLAVHKALPNRSSTLRQSVDARYQRADAPTLDKHLRPYGDVLSWEAIYAGWKSDRLKYYWRALAPRTVPWDSSYYDKRDEIAFEMAGRGDESARLILLRIVQQNPDPLKRARARNLLRFLDGNGQGEARSGAASTKDPTPSHKDAKTGRKLSVRQPIGDSLPRPDGDTG